MDNIKERKRKLRKRIKEKAVSLSAEYCKNADKSIFENVISLKEYQEAEAVFCYVSTQNEIDTFPFLKDILKSGKRLGVPKCLSYGVMEVYEIENLNQLQPGVYGILEPVESCRMMEADEIGFACVPCLSCSQDGRRLGYGGGFYDRYLPKLSCPKAVLCRSKLMEAEIPVDDYDVRVEIVVTEEAVMKHFPINA